MPSNSDANIRQIEFELEKAEHGMALPYDAERVGQLRKMLVEVRKRRLSAGLAAMRRRDRREAQLEKGRRSGGAETEIADFWERISLRRSND